MTNNLTSCNLPHSAVKWPHWVRNFFYMKILIFLNIFCVMNIQNGRYLDIRGINLVLQHNIKLFLHIFCICPIMSQLQFTYKRWYLNMSFEMGKNLTSHNLPHSVVKWPHWVRKFFSYGIIDILELILSYEHTKWSILRNLLAT